MERRNNDRNEGHSNTVLGVWVGVALLIGGLFGYGLGSYTSNTSSNSNVTTKVELPGPVLDPEENIEVPEDVEEILLCPISKQIMTNPVSTPYGHTYDKEFIEQHLKNSEKDPCTGQPLTKDQLTPNYSMRSMIESYKSTKKG